MSRLPSTGSQSARGRVRNADTDAMYFPGGSAISRSPLRKVNKPQTARSFASTTTGRSSIRQKHKRKPSLAMTALANVGVPENKEIALEVGVLHGLAFDVNDVRADAVRISGTLQKLMAVTISAKEQGMLVDLAGKTDSVFQKLYTLLSALSAQQELSLKHLSDRTQMAHELNKFKEKLEGLRFEQWTSPVELQNSIGQIESELRKLSGSEVLTQTPTQTHIHPLASLVYKKFQRLEDLVFVLRSKITQPASSSEPQRSDPPAHQATPEPATRTIRTISSDGNETTISAPVPGRPLSATTHESVLSDLSGSKQGRVLDQAATRPTNTLLINQFDSLLVPLFGMCAAEDGSMSWPMALVLFKQLDVVPFMVSRPDLKNLFNAAVSARKERLSFMDAASEKTAYARAAQNALNFADFKHLLVRVAQFRFSHGTWARYLPASEDKVIALMQHLSVRFQESHFRAQMSKSINAQAFSLIHKYEEQFEQIFIAFSRPRLAYAIPTADTRVHTEKLQGVVQFGMTLSQFERFVRVFSLGDLCKKENVHQVFHDASVSVTLNPAVKSLNHPALKPGDKFLTYPNFKFAIQMLAHHCADHLSTPESRLVFMCDVLGVSDMGVYDMFSSVREHGLHHEAANNARRKLAAAKQTPVVQGTLRSPRNGEIREGKSERVAAREREEASRGMLTSLLDANAGKIRKLFDAYATHQSSHSIADTSMTATGGRASFDDGSLDLFTGVTYQNMLAMCYEHGVLGALVPFLEVERIFCFVATARFTGHTHMASQPLNTSSDSADGHNPHTQAFMSFGNFAEFLCKLSQSLPEDAQGWCNAVAGKRRASKALPVDISLWRLATLIRLFSKQKEDDLAARAAVLPAAEIKTVDAASAQQQQQQQHDVEQKQVTEAVVAETEAESKEDPSEHQSAPVNADAELSVVLMWGAGYQHSAMVKRQVISAGSVRVLVEKYFLMPEEAGPAFSRGFLGAVGGSKCSVMMFAGANAIAAAQDVVDGLDGAARACVSCSATSEEADVSMRALKEVLSNVDAVERTMLIVLPDCIRSAQTILKTVTDSNLRVGRTFFHKFSASEIDTLFQNDVESQKPIYRAKRAVLSSGACLAVQVEGDDAVAALQAVCGPEDSTLARVQAPECVRAAFGTDAVSNGVYCCTSTRNATAQLSYVFDVLAPVDEEQGTLLLLKPDVIGKSKVVAILSAVTNEGFTVVQRRRIKLTRARVRAFLGDAAVLADEEQGEEGEGHVGFLSSDFMVALELRKKNAVRALCHMCGPSDPQEARRSQPNSLIALYGTNTVRNGMYCSPNELVAKRDISLVLDQFARAGEQDALLVLKPDVVKNGYVAPVLKRLVTEGFTVKQHYRLLLSSQHVRQMWGEVYAQDAKQGALLEKYMTSGVVSVLIVNKINGVKELCALVGTANVQESRKKCPSSLVALYGSTGATNGFFCPDNEFITEDKLQLLVKHIAPEAEQRVEEAVLLVTPDAFAMAPIIEEKLGLLGFEITDRFTKLSMDENYASALFPSDAQKRTLLLEGHSCAFVLKRECAIASINDACGPSDPTEARRSDAKSLRANYGTNGERNAVTCGTSHLETTRMIELFRRSVAGKPVADAPQVKAVSVSESRSNDASAASAASTPRTSSTSSTLSSAAAAPRVRVVKASHTHSAPMPDDGAAATVDHSLLERCFGLIKPDLVARGLVSLRKLREKMSAAGFHIHREKSIDVLTPAQVGQILRVKDVSGLLLEETSEEDKDAEESGREGSATPEPLLARKSSTAGEVKADTDESASEEHTVAHARVLMSGGVVCLEFSMEKSRKWESTLEAWQTFLGPEDPVIARVQASHFANNKAALNNARGSLVGFVPCVRAMFGSSVLRNAALSPVDEAHMKQLTNTFFGAVVPESPPELAFCLLQPSIVEDEHALACSMEALQLQNFVVQQTEKRVFEAHELRMLFPVSATLSVHQQDGVVSALSNRTCMALQLLRPDARAALLALAGPSDPSDNIAAVKAEMEERHDSIVAMIDALTRQPVLHFEMDHSETTSAVTSPRESGRPTSRKEKRRSGRSSLTVKRSVKSRRALAEEMRKKKAKEDAQKKASLLADYTRRKQMLLKESTEELIEKYGLRGVFGKSAIENGMHVAENADSVAAMLDLVFHQFKVGIQRSFLWLMPSCVGSGNGGVVVQRVLEAGFTIIKRERMRLTAVQSMRCVSSLAGDANFPKLTQYMASGPVVAVWVEKLNAFEALKELCGPVDAHDARRIAPHSINAMYGLDKTRCAVWPSATVEEAARDIDLAFRQFSVGLQRAFVMATPDLLVQERRALDLLARLRDDGFEVERHVEGTLTFAQVKALTAGDLSVTHEKLQHMASGPVMCLVVKKIACFSALEDTIGPKDPFRARNSDGGTSVRALWGQDKLKNCVYVSVGEAETAGQEKLVFEDYLAGKQEALLVIKPDTADDYEVVHAVLDRVRATVESASLTVVRECLLDLSYYNAQDFLNLPRENRREFDPDFDDVTAAYLSSKPVYAMHISGPRVWKTMEALVGVEPDPKVARITESKSLRAQYGVDGLHNALYVSPSVADGKRDLSFFYDTLAFGQAHDERTVLVIKPDVAQSKLSVLEIVNTLHDHGFQILEQARMQLTQEQLRCLYPTLEVKQPSAWEAHCEYLTSGESAVLCVHKPGAVVELLGLCGPSDPYVAFKERETSWRGKYGTDRIRNGVYCSSNVLDARRSFRVLLGPLVKQKEAEQRAAALANGVKEHAAE